MAGNFQRSAYVHCGAGRGGAGLAWWFYLPVAVECVAELMIWPLFRIRAHGPGVSRWPATGPLLIVANHSAYMDPFWVLKVVPRWVCPMMTSVFYDIPGIAWAMRHLIRAIRVPAATFRREAPELREAIDVLRRGGSILLFPEGKLRRSEEQLLSRFGQGVWHILQALPDATVLVAWIEGGWGSFTSYYNGLPMKNKRIDLWRHIDIAFDEPRVLPPEVLADQWATRVISCAGVPSVGAILDCRCRKWKMRRRSWRRRNRGTCRVGLEDWPPDVSS